MHGKYVQIEDIVQPVWACLAVGLGIVALEKREVGHSRLEVIEAGGTWVALAVS